MAAVGSETYTSCSGNPPSLIDSGNSYLFTSADGTTEFVGEWFDCRNTSDTTKLDVVAQHITIFCNQSTMTATFTFQWSSAASDASIGISEVRQVDDFSSLQDLPLMNKGNYFRMRFTPDEALTGGNIIDLATQQWYITPPPFVRLANQEIEEQNAAMGQVFSYQKNFNPFTGLSTNVRADAYAPAAESSTPLGISGTFDSGIIDASDFNYVATELFSDVSGSLTVYFYDDLAGTTALRQFIRPYTAGEGFAIFGSILTRPYYRYVYTNGADAQTEFHIATKFHKTALAGQILGLESFIPSNILTQVTRAVQVGESPNGVYNNEKLGGEKSSGTSGDSGSLPSGALPTYDPINTIVAANVIDTGWLDSAGYAKNRFRALFNLTGVKIFLIDAEDDQGSGSLTSNFAFPTATSTAFSPVNTTFDLFQRYYRMIIINDTGSTCTSWNYRSYWETDADGEVVISLDQPIFDFFPAPIVQSITKGKNPSGTYGAVGLNEADNLMTADFLTEVAKGNITGHELVRVVGRNSDIDTVRETIWAQGGTYVYPAAAAVVSLVSGSSLDTLAGTGAQTITVSGVDASYNELEETVDTNGLVAVTTVGSFFRVNKVEVATVGSQGSNQGDITATIGASVVASVAVGDNSSLLGLYTVPAGKTGYIFRVSPGAQKGASSGAYVRLLTRISASAPFIIRENFNAHTQSANVSQMLVDAIVCPENTDIQFDAETTSNNTQVSVSAGILLIDNSL